jgi:hypothetical protein
VSNNAAEIHLDEPVRSNKTNRRAVNAASVPVREISRASEIRRAAARDGVATFQAPAKREER